MTFRKFDAGALERAPFAKDADCQVRALCTALGIPYGEAWTMLYTMQGERRACGFELVKELDDRNAALNVVRELPFPASKGKRRMTAAEFCKKYKRGRFILRMAHHVVAVKDGQFYDTFDCSHSCVYKAWEILPRPTHPTSVAHEAKEKP